MGEEILPAPGERDHRERLELQAAGRLPVALVDDSVLVHSPVAEGSHRLPVGLQSLGIQAGKSLNRHQREVMRQIPRHPVHVAEADRRVLPIRTATVGRLHDDPVQDFLLRVVHPLAPEVEGEAEVHVGHDTVYPPPTRHGPSPVIGGTAELRITEPVPRIDQGLAEQEIVRDRRGRRLPVFLVPGEQAVEGHRGEAFRHIGHVGVLNARLLPLELLGNIIERHARGDIPFEPGEIPVREFAEDLAITCGGIPPAFLKELLHLDQRLLAEDAFLHSCRHRGDILGAEEHAGIDPGKRNLRPEQAGIETVGVVGGNGGRGPLGFRTVQHGQILR